MGKNHPYYGKSMSTNFPGSSHTMGFVAFPLTGRNWWENPCISDIMRLVNFSLCVLFNITRWQLIHISLSPFKQQHQFCYLEKENWNKPWLACAWLKNLIEVKTRSSRSCAFLVAICPAVPLQLVFLINEEVINIHFYFCLKKVKANTF